MCTSTVVEVSGRLAVYSFTTGCTFRREISLLEEWRANPNAVLERLAHQEQWEELEFLMERISTAL